MFPICLDFFNSAVGGQGIEIGTKMNLFVWNTAWSQKLEMTWVYFNLELPHIDITVTAVNSMPQEA